MNTYTKYDIQAEQQEEPELCPHCGEPCHEIVEHNWGSDADGNRGITAVWWECPNCD